MTFQLTNASVLCWKSEYLKRMWPYSHSCEFVSKCTASWFTLDKFVSGDKHLFVDGWQFLLLTVRDNSDLYISFLYSPSLIFSCLCYSS